MDLIVIKMIMDATRGTKVDAIPRTRTLCEDASTCRI